MIDVLLEHGPNGGDLFVEDPGLVRLTSGIETAVVLSLCGGNDEDDGTAATAAEQWWGNLDESGEAVLRSDVPSKLRTLPQTSANVQRIIEAVERSLAWLLDRKIVRELRVTAKVAPRRIDIEVATNIGGVTIPLNWAG